MTQPVNTSSGRTTHQMDQEIHQKINQIAAIADELPGVVIIHNLKKQMAVEYISPRGERELKTSLDEIQRLGSEYNYKFFNAEDAKDYVPKIVDLIQRNNDDEIVSFFQQVRTAEGRPWTWHMSTTKIFMRDEEGAPLLTITMAVPIDPLHHVTSKVSRLLEENNFLRQNLPKFRQLSNRECEVLAYFALGKSASETAEELHISVSTVETHRRNIKQKLETHSFYELTQYARAFDLI